MEKTETMKVTQPEEEIEIDDNSMEDKAYLLDSERAKEKDDMPGIANLVCSDNENERPSLTNS